MGRYGEYFTSAKNALKDMEKDQRYNKEDVELIRARAIAEDVSLEDKYNWRSSDNLPSGWRVRRKLGSNRKMIDFFLSPECRQFRGKNSVLEHLKSIHSTPSDILKIKSFTWFKKGNVKEEGSNTVEKIEAMNNEENEEADETKDLEQSLYENDESLVSSTTSDDDNNLSLCLDDSGIMSEELNSTDIQTDPESRRKVLESKLQELASEIQKTKSFQIESKFKELQKLVLR